MTEPRAGDGDERVEKRDEPAGGEPIEGGKPEDGLARLQRAFEAGDFRLLRELGREAERSGEAGERQGARELVRRTRVDPAMVVALLVCAALFFSIAYVYVLR